jgi:hypothetical protein
MKKEFWLPSVVFLAGSIPMVYFLQHMGWGGDYVLLLAMGTGALASAFVMPKKKYPADDSSTKTSAKDMTKNNTKK